MTQPPLFTKGYDLVLEIYKTSQKFPHSQKHVLAQHIQAAAITFMSTVVQGVLQRRSDLGSQAALSLEQLRIFVRLGHDLTWISHGKYEDLVRRIDELGRMLGGWLKKQK